MGKGLGESGSRHDFKKDVGHPRLRHARLDGAAQRTKALGFIKLVEGRDHNPGLVGDRLETQVRIVAGARDDMSICLVEKAGATVNLSVGLRSEEHTSELQSPMRISYA